MLNIFLLLLLLPVHRYLPFLHLCELDLPVSCSRATLTSTCLQTGMIKPVSPPGVTTAGFVLLLLGLIYLMLQANCISFPCWKGLVFFVFLFFFDRHKNLMLCCITLSHFYTMCHCCDNLCSLKSAENKMYRMH